MTNARAKSINASLYRKIISGKEYDKYFPYSDCSSIKLAEGDTKVAIDNMALWAKKYKHHTNKLASDLFAVTLHKKGLEVLCKELHSFLFWNFQYSIDTSKQNLRSPACAWSTRKEGIDCKSYSILASTTLLNLGIHHYLRRIKINPTEGYSHVYVVVPKNQKDPKNLDKGYFVIDGTLKHTLEPVFSGKDDVFMESTIIYGLAGVTEAKLPIYGLAGGLNNPLKTSLLNGASKVVNIAVQGLLNELVGCGDAKYDFPVVKLRVERDLQGVLQKKLKELEEAIQFVNRSRIQHLFNDIFKNIDLGIAHLRNEAAYSQQDECIAQTLAITLKYVEKIKEVFDTFFENFKKSFTRYKIDEFSKNAITSDRSIYFVVGNADNPIEAEHRYVVLRKPESKYGIEPIFPFEENVNSWLLKNQRHLINVYSDGREKEYIKEVTPLINKVIELRNQVHIGGNGLYLIEQPLQRKMYAVWLKYDTRYTDFLKTEAKSLRTANELAMRDYENRFIKEIEKDKEIKKQRKLKKQLGYGAIAVASFLVVKESK